MTSNFYLFSTILRLMALRSTTLLKMYIKSYQARMHLQFTELVTNSTDSQDSLKKLSTAYKHGDILYSQSPVTFYQYRSFYLI